MRWPLFSLALFIACRAPTPPDAGQGADAGGPCLAADPTAIDFGEIETDSRGSSFVRVTNLTSREVVLSSTPLEDPFSSDRIPERLPPNGNVLLGLRFIPPDGLLHFTSLQFSSSAGCSLEVPLRGLGAGRITVSPSVLDFGLIDPGKTRSLELTITNTKRTAVVFDQVRLMPVGSGPAPFDLGFTSPLIIPPAAITTVTVSTTPPGYDLYQANLILAGTSVAAGALIQVIGGAPVARLTPSSIDVPTMDFTDGSVPPSFVERTLTLRNEATDAGSPLSGLQLVPPFLEVRTEDDALTDEVFLRAFVEPIAAGRQGELIIQARPPGLGVRRYQLTFFTNDPERPEHRVDLQVNARSLPRCSLQHVQRVDFTAAPQAGSVGMVRFTNASGVSCVLDDVRIALGANRLFRVIDGGVDQLELADGEGHDVWLEGPDAGAGLDAGVVFTSVLSFHVLGPSSQNEGIELFASP
jgi:hypothetical protein